MNIYTHFCIFMQNVPRRVSPLLKIFLQQRVQKQQYGLFMLM